MASPPDKEVNVGTMSILSTAGDEKVTWDKNDPESIRVARQKFLEYLGERKGMAFKVDANGGKGEKMTDFDPSAENILLMPMIVGG